MIYTNWWCRDQNFRKYFEMRKKNDIRPSLSGFYHEKIYDDVAKQNASIAAMRHTQAAKWQHLCFQLQPYLNLDKLVKWSTEKTPLQSQI